MHIHGLKELHVCQYINKSVSLHEPSSLCGYLIYLPDGKSNRYPIDYAAPALKDAGVQVYTVGIGNVDVSELQFISSDPDDEHVFLLRSFRDAAGFVDFLSVTTCESECSYFGQQTNTN